MIRLRRPYSLNTIRSCTRTITSDISAATLSWRRSTALLLLCVLLSPLVRAQRTSAFQLTDNLIRVPVVINGHTVDAVLDTGTGTIGIDQSVVSSLGLRTEHDTATVLGGGVATSAFAITVQDLQMGLANLQNVQSFAIDLSHLTHSAGFPINVLLGYPVFKGQVISIDYPNRRITFTPPSDKSACTNPIAIKLINDVPIVEATIRRTPGSRSVTLHLVVDLGTRHYAAMIGGPVLKTREGLRMKNVSTPLQVGTGVGGSIAGSSLAMADLQIGTNHFPGLQVALASNVAAFVKGVADGTLGVPLWEDKTITLDYAHGQMCLSGAPGR